VLSAQPAPCHGQVVTALAGALAPYLSALPGTAALAAGVPATLALRLAGALLPGSYQGALTLNLAAATVAGRRANARRPAPWPQLTANLACPHTLCTVLVLAGRPYNNNKKHDACMALHAGQSIQ